MDVIRHRKHAQSSALAVLLRDAGDVRLTADVAGVLNTPRCGAHAAVRRALNNEDFSVSTHQVGRVFLAEVAI